MPYIPVAERRAAEQVAEAQTRELFILQAQVRAGHPRPYIEAYFKIAPEGGGALVPMRFENEPNQEYYYEQLTPMLLGDARVAPWLVDVLCLKDRKARWTSFVAALMAAKVFSHGGNHVFWVANAEDTFLVAHRLVDGFYRNMPGHARPEIKGNEWGVERKVLRFPTPDGGEVTSSFTIRTAANPNLGSGETPTDVVYDEYGKFPKTFGREAQASMRAAFTSAGFWRGGTVGPDGPDCAMYEEVQQVKRGERQTLYLFRTWFQNSANYLPPESRGRRPVDRLDEDIITGVDGGPNCEKEPLLVPQFPQDGVPVPWRLARRRSWMTDAMLASGQDAKVANIVYQREHCEDDETPWMIAGRVQFDETLLERQLAIAKSTANSLVMDESIHGLRLRMWQGYDPTHVYIMGMDFGSGSGGDDTSGQILDATSMTFIGEYHGNVVEAYTAAAGGKTVMSKFGNGMWAPEANRFPGIGNYIRNALGYVNTFKPPKRSDDTFEKWQKRPYGIYVGATHHSEDEPSKEEMEGRFKAMFNQGGFKVLNPLLLETMRRWDPERDKHTPDRIAGARLCVIKSVLARARNLQPVTGAAAPVPFHRHRVLRESRRHGAAGVWGINA